MEAMLMETTFAAGKPTQPTTESARKDARRIVRRTDLQHWLAAMTTHRDMLLVEYVEAHPELSMKQIALRFELTQPEVSRIANRFGVTRKRGRHKKGNY
jgi:hypothetical protein